MQYRYVYCIVCHEKDEEDEGKKYLPKFFLPPNEGVNDALKIARRGDYLNSPMENITCLVASPIMKLENEAFNQSLTILWLLIAAVRQKKRGHMLLSLRFSKSTST